MVTVLAAVFRRRKHSVGKSWRMDETYIKLAGEWKYLYRAIDVVETVGPAPLALLADAR
jgi:transposase-like protein